MKILYCSMREVYLGTVLKRVTLQERALLLGREAWEQ